MPIQHTHFPMIHLSLLQDQEREVSMKKMCTQSSTWKCHENLPEDLMCTKLCPNSTLMIFSIRVLPHPIHGIGQGSVPVLAFSCYLLSGQPSLSGHLKGSFSPLGIASTHAWLYTHSLIFSKSRFHYCTLLMPLLWILISVGARCWNKNWGKHSDNIMG